MTERHRVRRVLVPVDGSGFSRFAAQYAVSLAAAHGSDVVFLHVVDPEVIAALSQPRGTSKSAARQELIENGQVYLRDAAQLAEDAHVPHREELDEGDPATMILDTASRLDVDMVVMGRLGHRGARRMLVGSITQRVIECGDRPILVINGPPREG